MSGYSKKRMPTAKKKALRDNRGRKLCPHCGALMPARWFSRHLAEQHGSASGPEVPRGAQKRPEKLQCPRCGKTFAALSGLRSHLRFVHADKAAQRQPSEQPRAQERASPATAPTVAAKPQRTSQTECPQCGQTFASQHRLATHVQYRHADKSAAKAGEGTPKATAVIAPAPAPVVAPSDGVAERLKMALQELIVRQREIDEQLSRMETLQSEKEVIVKQIGAVNTALQAFER